MKTWISFIITALFFQISYVYGQTNQVYDRLTNSFEYGTKSKEHAGLTLDLIRKCYALSTVEEIQEFAGKAKDELDNVKTQLNFAILHATKAEEAAAEVNCPIAEVKSGEAESNYFTARSRFDEAFTYSLKAHSAENKDDFTHNLGKARKYAEDGISYIEDALKEINKAIEELENCPSGTQL
jgi:hypothetical protein